MPNNELIAVTLYDGYNLHAQVTAGCGFKAEAGPGVLVERLWEDVFDFGDDTGLKLLGHDKVGNVAGFGAFDSQKPKVCVPDAAGAVEGVGIER